MRNGYKPVLSLLTAYRNRQADLKFLLAYLDHLRNDEGFYDFELILVEDNNRSTMAHCGERYAWVRYQHVPTEGAPKRSCLLNQAASIAGGDYLMAYRMDMLPAEGVLGHHLALACASPHCLIAGYRLRLPARPSTHGLPPVSELIEKSISLNRPLAAPEDTRQGLLKALLTQERYAMGCCYPRTALEAAGGFNEDAEGREEQDLIQRVCENGLTLVRSYDLIYFQLPADEYH